MHPFYLLKRLGLTALTVLIATMLTFVLLRMTPGDPAQVIIQKVFVGSEDYAASSGERAAVAERLGLERPIAVQYLDWLAGALTLDLGHSYTTGRRVGRELGQRIWPTLSLTLLAMGCSLVLTLACSTAYALSGSRSLRAGIDGLIVTGIAVPNFYLALLLVLGFSLWLDALPVSGYGSAAHYVLPVATLTLTTFGYTTTILNDSVAAVRSREYILTARGKGLSPRVLFRRHVLRNAMVPVVPYIGLQLGYMLGGVVVVETVFSWPGLGKLLVDAIESRDTPVIQACVALLAVGFSLANLLADVALRVVDPRVRFQED
mgnify:CR=1 FL=1